MYMGYVTIELSSFYNYIAIKYLIWNLSRMHIRFVYMLNVNKLNRNQ
jgi:hypothetical protein